MIDYLIKALYFVAWITYHFCLISAFCGYLIVNTISTIFNFIVELFLQIFLFGQVLCEDFQYFILEMIEYIDYLRFVAEDAWNKYSMPSFSSTSDPRKQSYPDVIRMFDCITSLLYEALELVSGSFYLIGVCIKEVILLFAALIVAIFTTAWLLLEKLIMSTLKQPVEMILGCLSLIAISASIKLLGHDWYVNRIQYSSLLLQRYLHAGSHQIAYYWSRFMDIMTGYAAHLGYPFDRIKNGDFRGAPCSNRLCSGTPTVEDLALELERTAAEMRCVVCLCNPRCIITFPCRHLSMCSNCARRICNNRGATCPLCRSSILYEFHVYR